MKKVRTGFLCMLLLLVCCLIPGEQAHAATKAKKLFLFYVNDGTVKQKVPIYEYTEDNGKVSVGVKDEQKVLQTMAGAKKATFTIEGKTAYFKKNYKSITYIKNVNISTNRALTFKLKTKKNVQRPLKITLSNPSINALKTSAKAFTTGSSKLKIQFNVRSGMAVKSYFKIKNSNGKVVYEKTLGNRKSTNFTINWSGKPSKGNAAGLSTSKYVPAGPYEITGYLEYQVGKKVRTLSKTVTVMVRNTNTAGSTDNNSSSKDFKAKNWNWKVILSGDDTLDYMVEKVCQELLTNNMSEIQRAKVLYNWCDKNLTHIYTNINVKTSQAKVDAVTVTDECISYSEQVDKQIASGKAAVDWTDQYFGSKETGSMKKTKLNWIKAGMTQKKGNCLVMAAIYQTLLRHAGIEAHIIENTLPSGGGGHHFWNAVKIGSKYYYCDIDMTTYGSGVSDGSYTWFLRGTNNFYKENRYKKVKSSKYAIAKKVSASDCPGR